MSQCKFHPVVEPIDLRQPFQEFALLSQEEPVPFKKTTFLHTLVSSVRGGLSALGQFAKNKN